ncbi:MAG: sugar ABC transporter substrate-binding protein [Chloroflexota bacterium]|nr:sugar ABC transporter substrate-binding protein [Chloroflexota bacterium]
MEQGTSRRVSRRQLLKGAALILGSIPGVQILGACGPAAAPAAATSQPAAGAVATAAPAAVATVASAAPGAAATVAAAAPGAAATVVSVATAAAQPVTSAQRIVVRDHDWLQGNPGQQGDWYDAFIAKFEDAHPDIKVEREWFPRNDMHAKQIALAATGQIGDTVRISLAPLVAELQIKGIVRDLDSLYQSDQQWMSNDQKQFWPGNIKTYTRQGKLWGLPIVGHPGAVQYYVNRTMVEKAGLKMPSADGTWTYDDMLGLAKGLTRSEGGRTTVYGVIPPVGDTSVNEGMVGFLRAFGGDLYDVDGKQCLLNTPESKAGLKVFADLYTSGSAYPWQPDISEQTPELFQSQKVGMAIQTSFAASAWPDQIAKRPEPFEMEVIPNPLGPTGKHATQVSSDGKGVTTASKNPDKAWIVLSQLYTSQRHGIERFTNGLGSPGSRFDVWDSDEFKQKAPKLDNIARVMVLPPAPDLLPWHYPANGRFAEVDSILINEWVKVTLGQLDVDKFADDTAKQVQAIMDKPAV